MFKCAHEPFRNKEEFVGSRHDRLYLFDLLVWAGKSRREWNQGSLLWTMRLIDNTLGREA